MVTIKCKMCGGNINVGNNEKVVTCEYCDTNQTVPSIDNEKIVLYHNRANTQRLKNEFDKAIITYESIINENPEDAEAYWGLLLCKYGIEYVDDPKTGRKTPTCHRTHFKSIFNDQDYLNAIKYSDVVSKSLYEKEAEIIDNIQKNILVLSQKEEPYDVFICYKESDQGKRTRDSVIAQEIYDVLTSKGYKVFFAKITLESKLGSQYEPIIFAALNSSKVMIVLGTKPEYFTAAWVKNEWSRFISFMEKSEGNKYIIPCYRDMDAYDLPDELVSFQCQDMNKLGFIQDLTRGLDKMFNRTEPKPQQVTQNVYQSSVNINALLDRCEILLKLKDFNKVRDLIEEILNNDPRNSVAYYYAMLCDFGYSNEDELSSSFETLEKNTNYNLAIEYATGEYKQKLINYNNQIIENIENKILQDKYNKAIDLKKQNDYLKAIEVFKSIVEFKDSKQQIDDCFETIYDEANKKKSIMLFEQAIEKFKTIIDYKDSRDKIEEMSEDLYQKALKDMENLDFDEALTKLKVIKSYKDSSYMYDKCNRLKSNKQVYNQGRLYYLNENYFEAINCFRKIIDFPNANEYLEKCYDVVYNQGLRFINNKEYDEAKKIFIYIESYKDSFEKYEECVKLANDDKQKNYDKAIELINLNKFDEAYKLLKTIVDYKNVKGKLEEIEDKTFVSEKNLFIKKKIFGRFPQSLVKKESLIEKLKGITEVNKNGYIEYDGKEYYMMAKKYYLVEPLKWKILEEKNGIYKIITEDIISQTEFALARYNQINGRTINGKCIHINNYEYSNVRAFLNGYDGSKYKQNNYLNKGFLDMAFSENENEIIQTSKIIDDETIKMFSSNVVNDKVTILSVNEATSLYFEKEKQARADLTKFASDESINIKTYWLRTIPAKFAKNYDPERVVTILSNGFACDQFVGFKHGVRPVVYIKIK